MGMAVCSVGVWRAVLKLRDVKHTHTHTLQLRSAAPFCSFYLLQHLASCFRQLCCKETTCSQSASGKYDGHSFGDAHEWLEDADAQDGRQLTEGVQEAKCGAPEIKRQKRVSATETKRSFNSTDHLNSVFE